MANVKSYRPLKLISFRNILATFLAHKLSTLRALFINSKCEKLLTLYPLFIDGKCEKLIPFRKFWQLFGTQVINPLPVIYQR
jgi:hypothetical protein